MDSGLKCRKEVLCRSVEISKVVRLCHLHGVDPNRWNSPEVSDQVVAYAISVSQPLNKRHQKAQGPYPVSDRSHTSKGCLNYACRIRRNVHALNQPV